MKRLAYILALLVVLALPAMARASADAVIRDCADDGKLEGHYSNSDLDQAEKNLPSDLNEYSDCAAVIAAAKTSGSDTGGGGSSSSGGGQSGGSAPSKKPAAPAASAKDKAALNALGKRLRNPKLEIGGRTVEPGPNGLFHLATASNGMPLPLLLALIAVGALALGGGLFVLRRRFPAFARIPRPRLSAPRLDLSRVPFPRSRR